MSPSFAVVGVGASAGGLDAFRKLLESLPADTGMGFVLIQHLAPDHASFLVEALAKATSMEVTEAAEGVWVEPNRVYVIPPNAEITIRKGQLHLRRRSGGKAPHLPLDWFLESLAADRGDRAMGVVLSGSASDGTEGLRAIKAANGITFAQEPASAAFGGMPQSAVDAGVVDYVLPVAAIGEEIARLSRHSFVAGADGQPPMDAESTLRRIFAVVRNVTGVDFGDYKPPTVLRRLARRMALRRVDHTDDYCKLVESDPEEVRRLYEDVLIHVTSFFRDPDVFEALKKDVFPVLLEDRPEDAPLRVWVAGCSTGQEVYSIAIALLDFLRASDRSRPIQIFGSDVSEKVIETARRGVYPHAAMGEMGEERAKRYFSKLDGGYQIKKEVRDLCVFVRHDLANDPPFSKLDLVSCRNVLIYFDQALQKRVIPMLHYCLQQPGFLLLGHTENVSGFSRLFAPTDKSHRLFSRTAAPSTLRFAERSEVYPAAARGPERPGAEGLRGHVDLARYLDKVLLSRYAPPGVLIDAKLDVLQFRGETGAYLQPAPGEPRANLVKMARRGLFAPLRAALAEAKKTQTTARQDATVDQAGYTLDCRVLVVPLTGMPGREDPLFVVMFEPAETPREKRTMSVRAGPTRAPAADARRLTKLEHELGATREYLETLVEEHDRANDHLGLANDELTTANEELQSLNEELETAKEELQSTNEELTTVNAELHSRNQDVNQINGDLLNLLDTVDIPILILDMDRRIRRFTPKARGLLNVAPSDVGRPLQEIRSNLDVPDLDAEIARAIDTNSFCESEVRDRKGHWHRMQIRPYRTTDNRIDGAILSFVDIDALKHHVTEAETATADAERSNRAKDQFLATLSHELRTPLAAILLQAELLRGGELDAERTIRAGESIERGTRMQVKLIDDLLDVSRIVAGKLHLEMEPVDTATVVRAALDAASGLAARKNIQVTVELAEPVGPILGDSRRLQQVVSNLLVNAIKFTPEGGQVKVVLEGARGLARLTVSDTGMGIPAAFLPHVFNRFRQEDSSTTRTYGGLGIGLAIVRHLVEAHGGSVLAQSAGPKQGAQFMVELPLLADGSLDNGAAARAGSVNPAQNHEGRLRDRRILIVDDDAHLRHMITEVLQRAGATVDGAESAASAALAVAAFHPELILCDIAMPGEDGYSFIRGVRSLDAARGGNIPAVALTALAGEDDRQRALAAGFQAHIAKPFDIGRLVDVLVRLAGDGEEHRPQPLFEKAPLSSHTTSRAG